MVRWSFCLYKGPVLTLLGSGRRQIILHKPNLVGRVSFEDEPFVAEQFTLKPSCTYVLIPCTFMPSQEGRFSLEFQSTGSVDIQPLPEDREWKWVTAKDEWRGKSAGGCRNHLTCINNPQFLLRTRKATTCTILLSQNSTEAFDAIGFYVLAAKCRSNGHCIGVFETYVNSQLPHTSFPSSVQIHWQSLSSYELLRVSWTTM